jgi:hypothetical protein
MKKISAFLIACAFVFAFCTQVREKISKQNIFSATKLFDISFTQQEVDSLFDAVQDNADNYVRLHQLQLNNNVPMSLWQSPVLPGMKFSHNQESIDWNIPSNVALPANKNDLAFYSVVQLASLIKNKKIRVIRFNSCNKIVSFSNFQIISFPNYHIFSLSLQSQKVIIHV